MHIRKKRQLLAMLSMLQDIQSKIQALDADSRLEILQKCQETAIVLGESIEKDVIEDSHIIPLLEGYCEKIYLLSRKEEILSGDIEEINSALLEIQEHMENLTAMYRVVFLPYKADMWDSLESIWKAFSEDSRFECNVVPIPYFEANQQEKKWEPRYDGGRFPHDVPITNYEYYRLEEMQPDIAFVHNPFDNCNYVTSVHPDFYSDELKKYVKKLVYVPYYVNTGFIGMEYQQLPMLQNMDYMIVQSEKAKASCKGQSYYDRILPFGSPKFDRVIQKNSEKGEVSAEWNKKLNGKKSLMLNTTINDLLNNGEKLIAKLQDLFQKINLGKNIVLIWRPHPLLEATIKAMRPALLKEYHRLVTYFNENDIGIFDTTGDISGTIALADGYIGSNYSSVVNLFAVCGKPIYILDSQNIYGKDHQDCIKKNAVEVFYKRSERGYFACVESAEYTLEDFIVDLTAETLGEVKERQLESVKDIAANLDGTCGQKVHDFMVSVLETEYGI